MNARLLCLLILAAVSLQAQSTIVYHRYVNTAPHWTNFGVTTNLPIGPDGIVMFPGTEQGRSFQFDLNQDGTNDFTIVAFTPPNYGFFILGAGTNAIYSRPDGPSDITGSVTALDAGCEIGPRLPLPYRWETTYRNNLLGDYGPHFSAYADVDRCSGDWCGSRRAYCGVQFQIGSAVHYGWMLIQEVAWFGGGGVLYEYAYESRPNTSIKAGARPVPLPLAQPSVARPGYLRLQWASEISKAYQLQYKDRIESFAWGNLDFIVTATATNTVVDVPMSSDTRFFRVVKAD